MVDDLINWFVFLPKCPQMHQSFFLFTRRAAPRLNPPAYIDINELNSRAGVSNTKISTIEQGTTKNSKDRKSIL
jgi:hypothetical protein